MRQALLIRDAQVLDAQGLARRVDVRVRGALIGEVGVALAREAHEEVIEAAESALLPGLHDHHLHLLAMAAAARSVPLGPPQVRSYEAFAQTLSSARDGTAPGEWVRGVGYHDSVAGPLDRDVLDRIVGDRPVRVQHRSGALWILNSAALKAAELDRETDPDVERDKAGRLTGRLLRWDSKLITPTAPDLGAVGARLSGFGITGVTDATPDLDDAAMTLLTDAASNGALPQKVMLLGVPLGQPSSQLLTAGFQVGPYKILLRDHDLPTLDALTERVGAAHTAGRAVAVHCVTRESLVLTLAALTTAGVVPGDRIEHGAVIPPELAEALAGNGLRVVTQPAFIAERGDAYVSEVDPADLECLYPYASLRQAGVAVAPSSDAPFGELDPWRVMAAAASRLTESGQLLGARERVATQTALNGYLSAPHDPGGPPRRIQPGAPADLCLLSVPLEEALGTPNADGVRLTMSDGVWRFRL
jgi:predicted amidohydrolase YtcJ